MATAMILMVLLCILVSQQSRNHKGAMVSITLLQKNMYTQRDLSLASLVTYVLSWTLLTLVLSINVRDHAWGEAPILEMRRSAIRNGNLQPTQVILSPEQQRAIGWFYHEDLLGSEEVHPSFCTGTVISSNAVLTARHCFVDTSVQVDGMSELRFELDEELYFSIMTEEPTPDQGLKPTLSLLFRLRDVRMHPEYDIAVVQFEGTPFLDPELKVMPIPINAEPLDHTLAVNLMNTMVDVGGYGLTYHEGEPFGRYFATVKLELITPEFLMVSGQSEQGICQGDSGGPLLAAGVDGNVQVFGVVREGDACCVGIDQITRIDTVADYLSENFGAQIPPYSAYPLVCEGVSRRNRCEGDFLVKCTANQVTREDCSQAEQSCGYNPDLGRFSCLDAPACPPQGYCRDDGILVRCERGVPREIECVASECQMIEDGQRPACVALEEYIACDDDNFERLYEASQARFSAESGCQSYGLSPLKALLTLALLVWINPKRWSV